MINIKEKCTACNHHEICKFSKDYIEFGDRMSNLSNKLDGEIIAESVAQIEIRCKYFRPITSTPRSSFDER